MHIILYNSIDFLFLFLIKSQIIYIYIYIYIYILCFRKYIVIIKWKKKKTRKKGWNAREKLNRFSLGAPPFYRELQKIYMDDHPQVTIVVQNLIFYNTSP